MASEIEFLRTCLEAAKSPSDMMLSFSDCLSNSVVENRMKEAKEEFEEDRLFRAHRIVSSVVFSLEKYLTLLRHHDSNILKECTSPESVINILENKVRSVRGDRLTCQILAETAEVTEIFRNFIDDDGWMECGNSDGIHTQCKYKDGVPTLAFKMDGMIDASLLHILSLVNEMDLFSTWVPAVIESKQIFRFSRSRRILYGRLWCPWPVAYRDSIISGYLADLLDEANCVALMAKTPMTPGNDIHHMTPLDIPPCVDGDVRADVHQLGLIFRAVTPTTTYVYMLLNGDPKLSYTPYWVLNMLTSTTAHLTFWYFRETAKKLSLDPEAMEHGKRIQNEDYIILSSKLNEHFNKI